MQKTIQRLATMGHVGIEMAAPIGLGVLIDYWLGSLPWITIVMALLGFSFGIVHLIRINRSRDVR